MAHRLIVRPDGSIAQVVTEGEVTRAYADRQGIVWLDYDELPDPEQLVFLRDLFGLGAGAIEHLTEPHRGPRATPFRDYMLIVVYDVSLAADAQTIDRDEVVLLFTNRALVTVHRHPSAALSPADGHIERALDRFGIDVAAIVYAVLEAIADEYLRVLETVKTRVDALEVRVLQQEEQEGIGDLYQLRRQLTQLRSVLAPEAALIGMRAGPNPFIGNSDIQDAMLDVKHKMQCAVDEIDQYLALLPDILTTFESLKADNLNQIVKLLTVWSIILTAVALFPSVLGISLAREPSISPYVGYVVSLVAMVVVGVLVWYGFRRTGWID